MMFLEAEIGTKRMSGTPTPATREILAIIHVCNEVAEQREKPQVVFWTGLSQVPATVPIAKEKHLNAHSEHFQFQGSFITVAQGSRHTRMHQEAI